MHLEYRDENGFKSIPYDGRFGYASRQKNILGVVGRSI